MSRPYRFFFICALSTITIVTMLLYLYKHTSTKQSQWSLTKSSPLDSESTKTAVEAILFIKELPSRSKKRTTQIKEVATTQGIQELPKKPALKHLHAYPDVNKKMDNETGANIVYKSFQLKGKQSLRTKKIKDENLLTKQIDKGKFQKQQVEKFCNKYKLNKQRLTLPPSRPSKTNFFKRLLHNDEAKTIFCIAPKVGSTSLIVLYFIAQGLLPDSVATISRGQLSNSELQDLVDHHSLSALSEQERLGVVKKYYKFVMYRNPLERLVSGYRSKVQNYPLIGFEDKNPHYNWLRHNIYQKTHPVRYQDWRKKDGKDPIQIPFVDFVKFWLSGGKGSSDPHFRPIFDLCEPCRVRYSYYGNFDTFQDDAQVLMDKIGASSNQLRQGFYGNHTTRSTSNLVETFYSELTVVQKRGVLKKLSQDLDFYYHVFPSEIDVHKRLLQLDDELTVP